MKKSLFLCLLFMILFSVPLFAAAENDPESCICGRPYYTEDTGVHQKYDCVACGEKISNCSCRTCWCGHEIMFSQEGSRICSGCGKVCLFCLCADRDTMLEIENEKRIGRVSLGETPKPGTVWAALLFLFFTGAVAVLCYRTIFHLRRNGAIAHAAEEEKQKEERRRIMLKIEAEQNGGKTLKQKREETQIARDALHWDIRSAPLGTVLFELVNAARFLRRKGKTSSPALRYTLSCAQDSSQAVQRAVDGEFGEIIKDAVNVIDFYDNDFYDFVKAEYSRLMPDIAENELVHLTNAACSFDLRAGAALPVLKNYADSSLEELELGVRMPQEPARFEEDAKGEEES